MPDLQQANLIQERAYDAFPYESHAFGQTHPVRLAAAAHLLGLESPDVSTARVLELGCAAGGNIIPMAAYFPNAHFVGVDISGKQIEDGRSIIDDLGLKNIELRKGSVTDIGPDFGVFDYIVAHGVYSWVSPETRRQVLRVAHDNLHDDGVVYISFNCNPGWHQKRIARDLMLFHTEGITDPQERVKASRTILNQVARQASGSYGAVLNAERDAIDAGGDYYIRHDHIADENNPVYFREIIAEADLCGLTYLCEADIADTAPQTKNSAVAAQIRKRAGNDYQKTQQYLDFFLGRMFRMSLFVKSGQANTIRRHIEPERVQALHFTYRNTIVQQYPQDEPVADTFESQYRVFANDDNFIGVESKLSARVLEFLRDSEATHPATFSFEEFLAHAAAPGEPTAEDREAVSRLLLELIRRKMLWYSSVPLRCSPVSERPKIFALVADDLAHNRSHSTNILHDRVNFTYPASRQFLRLLDGTRDLMTLKQTVYDLVMARKMRLESALGPFDRMADTHAAVTMYVERTLQHFAKIRILES